MRSRYTVAAVLATAAVAGSAFLIHGQARRSAAASIERHRNLGKAFYENSAMHAEAAEEFRLALELAPNSAREHLNFGLALLRAGDLTKGVAELQAAQKLDPKLPHTWFNLGLAFKREGDTDRALAQFAEMEQLVPDDAITHYQLGAVHKAKGDNAAAIQEFERARDLAPRLAGPHFQLFGLYRDAERTQESAAEIRIFRDLKKEQEGAAVPEDMEWSAYCEIYDPAPPPVAAPAAPVYHTRTLAAGFGAAPSGAVALNVDGGQRPSFIAWAGGHASLWLNGTTRSTNSGLETLKDVVSIAPGDFDNDGLPDLCVITTGGALLFRNDAGHFQQTAELATGSFRKAVWIDFDHDYDQDLILLGTDSRLLRNNGTAGFGDESSRFPFVHATALDAVTLSQQPDQQGFDLAAVYEGRPGVLYRDHLGGTYTAEPFPAPAPAMGNSGALADFEGKGRLDRAFVTSDGGLRMDRDVTERYGNWVEIALTGVKNPKIPLNASVEVKSGAFYARQIYTGTPLVFRLGDRNTIDTVRIGWPNGLIQNEVDQPVNRVLAIKEVPQLAGSCPMIFTWNGSRFEFITDVLGVAPLGASSGDGQFFPVDHDEYVSIPGDLLRAENGLYPIRITEELREVSYIDQVKLMALDHPASVDIVTNEKFKSPPFPKFRLFGASHRINPVIARDSSGKDARAALEAQDGIYAEGFRRQPDGSAELHHLDLDFGRAAQSNRAVLFLEGWVDWADGSTFMAATQAHNDLIFPYLQVRDAAGNWKTVIEDMGMPSGKPKTMAVDLTGKFLSASREVRIVTNLCVYWDQIYLAEDSAAPPARLTPVPMAVGDLHFRGFSHPVIDPQRRQPERFDYQKVSFDPRWNPTPGNYTRYGSVAGLLAEPDDRMVVMGSGDELKLLFNPAGLPQLPEGWKRDFVLLVDGWAKDRDANTAFGQSVLPLPFHAMSSYPYPAKERFPEDPAHLAYQSEFNTRPALRLIRPLH